MTQGSLIQDPFELAGTLLEGQYRVDAIVGEGGFGVVYRGRHLSLDQPIAIKVLKGLDGGDSRINALVLEKFRTEARLLYTLSQSSLHIVRALDFGAATMPSGVWAPYMILEWLDGRSLSDDLGERRDRGMRGRSLAEALAILEPVANGLAVAHDQQVAHRDIKPANIFLGASGRHGPQVKVLDFGIAKIMKEGESAGTKGTFASFTWLYASPEQLDPRYGATGLATDVYAFALLLTELLTDRKPVDEHDVIAIMKAATDPSRRPTPRTRGANVPDVIETICQRALSVDPKNRYRSISELWAALAAARSGARGVTTMPPPAAVAPQQPVFIVTPPSFPTGSDPNPFGATTPPNVQGYRPTPPPPAPLASPPIGPPPPFPRLQAMSPPLGTAPPGQYPTGYGPPPGTAPPGYFPRRLPFVRADTTSPLVVLAIIVVVFAMLFAGSCAMIAAAC